ncbi:hypothetical protein VP01_456g3 [Puccinia sorghi]|uniref:Uncharacterized protein n=1 Tax=Puccinia sorghi TaxID=27349 RepID=A0A0L6UPI3_9BASI|nr:hypothetical protein VP01_456g3 [Puccinia sorghi]
MSTVTDSLICNPRRGLSHSTIWYLGFSITFICDEIFWGLYFWYFYLLYFIHFPLTKTILSPYIGSGSILHDTESLWLWECTNHQAQDLHCRVKGGFIISIWGHVQLWEKEGVWENLLRLGDYVYWVGYLGVSCSVCPASFALVVKKSITSVLSDPGLILLPEKEKIYQADPSLKCLIAFDLKNVELSLVECCASIIWFEAEPDIPTSTNIHHNNYHTNSKEKEQKERIKKKKKEENTCWNMLCAASLSPLYSALGCYSQNTILFSENRLSSLLIPILFQHHSSSPISTNKTTHSSPQINQSSSQLNQLIYSNYPGTLAVITHCALAFFVSVSCFLKSARRSLTLSLLFRWYASFLVFSLIKRTIFVLVLSLINVRCKECAQINLECSAARHFDTLTWRHKKYYRGAVLRAPRCTSYLTMLMSLTETLCVRPFQCGLAIGGRFRPGHQGYSSWTALSSVLHATRWYDWVTGGNLGVLLNFLVNNWVTTP